MLTATATATEAREHDHMEPYIRFDEAVLIDGERAVGWFAYMAAPGHIDQTSIMGPFESAIEAAEAIADFCGY